MLPQKDDNKTSTISPELAEYRVGKPCPTCGDYLVIMVPRYREDPETGRISFSGHYGVCAGHSDDTDHYQLSPGGGKKGMKPRETTGSPLPRKFLPEVPGVLATRVVKRTAAGIVAVVRR